ncbi:MAG: YibE/F family protein [bacterium]
MFLLFTLSEDQPLWVLVNSEFIAEEIVRTMAGSIALVLAVPITTLLAAYSLRRG